MSDRVDLYCERCGPEFWAEPLNALTNAVFLLAAFFAYRSAKHHRAMTGKVKCLIGLAVAVGVGSFLFHTFATLWAMYSDIIPIVLLQLSFFGFYARDQIGLSRTSVGVLLAGLLAVSLPGMGANAPLNGSAAYLPGWALLAVFGAHHIRQSKNQPWGLLAAAILLLLALVFRTIDLAVCAALPCGTHFLWHLFNGGVVFLVIQSLIVNHPNPVAPAMSPAESEA